MRLKLNQRASSLYGLLFAAAFLLLSSAVNADTLDRILSNKKIIIGVSKDQGVLSQLNLSTGVIEGFEPDLAKDLANSLGVSLELVPLTILQRESAIMDKKVDVLIASLSDTSTRRKVMLPVIPHYYLSGVNVLTRKDENIKSWEDLRGQRVCSEYGTFYNRLVTVRFGIDLIPLHGHKIAVDALSDGRCVGILYEESTIGWRLQDTDWGKQFHIPLEKMQTPAWSIYLNINEKDGKLEKIISDTVVRWHRDGVIMELEKKWKFPASSFSSDMNTIWNKKNNNEYFCKTPINNQTPHECLK
jgi:polar amino acid transport system substrate-binding protein